MGDDPRTSVVDRNLRTHDHPNLYLVGSSTFPTITASPPTLTIAAFALRAALHDPDRALDASHAYLLATVAACRAATQLFMQASRSETYVYVAARALGGDELLERRPGALERHHERREEPDCDEGGGGGEDRDADGTLLRVRGLVHGALLGSGFEHEVVRAAGMQCPPGAPFQSLSRP